MSICEAANLMGSMRSLLVCCCCVLIVTAALAGAHNTANASLITQKLFWELEQLARIVDIAYCVGTAGLGIQKPFRCASRCSDGDFDTFELVTAWNTGPFLSDSCGYIAISHSRTNPRLILAFRGTYSVANTIADLSTIPQPYVPYPTDHDDDTSEFITPRVGLLDRHLPPAEPAKCDNCTVHTGFYSSWLNTRNIVLPHVSKALQRYPTYKLVLVGHSLGGAVATLAGLDFKARGWDPHVTTFGEPRLGNNDFNTYVNERFNITSNHEHNKMHRVTHVGDPVPLLPLSEWGFSMHSEEIFISESSLPLSIADIHYCDGDEDPHCIAGGNHKAAWRLPARFNFWQLFFAHRDYFWRLGLCMPSGDPRDWYGKYSRQQTSNDEFSEIDEL
ncbi:Extracellular triacylglycerol lipase [Pyrenophora seminiperda CCB06]|uniref:Extracellular triacylglycerol lipase n=1 Tax=Pyrenophora seminiperda CCB06 TaxID=1302712 RepID=A0A3M7MHS3_9PLEO|nr:Extracellular triacylglycerol lipase [Pyrenophora seminiperda CCB06]